MQFQFFEWDSIGTPERSWWVYFRDEVPKLAEMGVTIVWLPRECATGQRFRYSYVSSISSKPRNEQGGRR
jgi:hypothetical protein